MNGRDFTQFIAATARAMEDTPERGFGSLNGTRANQMNWQIDGVDNNDFWHNIPAVNQGGVSGIAGVVMPLDAIDEFAAQTQSNAEGGRNAGGIVNVVLKSGTQPAPRLGVLFQSQRRPSELPLRSSIQCSPPVYEEAAAAQRELRILSSAGRLSRTKPSGLSALRNKSTHCVCPA